MKKIIIAISGLPGSGKSTYAKLIAEYFNLRLVSVGSLFRKIAEKHGLNLASFHKLAESNHEFDLEVDNIAREEAKKGNVVVEGHLACWTLKDIADLKIFLHAPLEERIKRIMKRDSISYEEAKKDILFREESNRRRFKEIYNYDIELLKDVDVLLNTSLFDVQNTFKILICIIESYLSISNVANNYRKVSS